jgi:hypothetical protein
MKFLFASVLCLLFANLSIASAVDTQQNVFIQQIQNSVQTVATPSLATHCQNYQLTAPVTCPSLVPLLTATPIQTYNALELLITKLTTVIGAYAESVDICLTHDQVYALHQMEISGCWPAYVQNNVPYTFNNLATNTADAPYWAEQLQQLMQQVQMFVYPSGTSDLCNPVYTMVNHWNQILI